MPGADPAALAAPSDPTLRTIDANAPEFAAKVRSAVIWRSGSQILAQLITWGSTLLVLMILRPADYGLFAMTQVVLSLMTFFNGTGFATALTREPTLDRAKLERTFGLLIALNAGIALAQLLASNLIAAGFAHPELGAILRWQALLYVPVPFIAIGEVLLARRLEYRSLAITNICAGIAGALTSLALAFAGFGVWTLVAAPIVLFAVRAVGITIAAGGLPRPRFELTGLRGVVTFGGALLLVHACWLVQTSVDIVIGGRRFGDHQLGLYAEALFFAQVLAARFVPPLNDVAFATYARMAGQPESIGPAFLRATRALMTIALPVYAGLAVTASSFVPAVLGPQWDGLDDFLVILAAAMPAYTLYLLHSPVTNAQGRPDVTLRAAALGAVVFPLAYLIGARFGVIGLAWAWFAATPIQLAAAMLWSRRFSGVGPARMLGAVAPSAIAALGMAAVVFATGRALADLAPAVRLAAEVAVGLATYPALLHLVDRGAIREVIAFVARREIAPAPAAQEAM